MRYDEDVLQSWTSPLSKTEEQRVKNAINMIKSAVMNQVQLKDFNVEVFAQGSYANNTNVRQESDVDVCIMLKSAFFCNYVEGKNGLDYGHIDSNIKYSQYKEYVIDSMAQKFGTQSIKVKNKSVNVASNSYRVNADVIPAFQYRDFRVINSIDSSKYIEGIKFFASDGTEVINYPKIHICNGRQKNIDTNHQYKKIVRVMKHIRNNMLDDGIVDGDRITSFLIECLIWNVPDEIIMAGTTWEETIEKIILYLCYNFKNNKSLKFKEVSGYLDLFNETRKWTVVDVQRFLIYAYDYLEF